MQVKLVVWRLASCGGDLPGCPWSRRDAANIAMRFLPFRPLFPESGMMRRLLIVELPAGRPHCDPKAYYG